MVSEAARMPNDLGTNDVIVADNDSIIRGILRSVLEAEGFTVLSAVNGVEAIDLAMRTRARLIILDYKMPRLDGVTSCAEIRALDGYAEVPILILTAFDDAAIRQKAERAGATAFLAKPFTPVDLLRTIARLVGPSPRKGHTPAGLAEPAAVVWNRRPEPAPLFGEPVEFSEGRRVLGICRTDPHSGRHKRLK
jgi:two-component system, chemotaxis family, chemotaxis protein CheY